MFAAHIRRPRQAVPQLALSLQTHLVFSCAVEILRKVLLPPTTDDHHPKTTVARSRQVCIQFGVEVLLVSVYLRGKDVCMCTRPILLPEAPMPPEATLAEPVRTSESHPKRGLLAATTRPNTAAKRA
jgi:hypothetical protein